MPFNHHRHRHSLGQAISIFEDRFDQLWDRRQWGGTK